MKTTLCLLLVFPCLLFAQSKSLFVNGQLHRDLHREIFTSTVEVFQIDRLGTTFFFTDFDFHQAGETGAYFEVARNFTVVTVGPFVVNATLQFNDGVLDVDGVFGKQIPRTVLGGVALSNLRLGPAVVEVQGLMRQEMGVDPGWQFTAVWGMPVPGVPLEFRGYLDWNTNVTGDQPASVQTEPQLLCRLGSWAVGTEVEISRNFSGAFTETQGFAYRTWYTHPTVFVSLDF